MNKSTFLNLLLNGDYNQIIYQYSLENGRQKLRFDEFNRTLQYLFDGMYQMCYLMNQNPPSTYSDLVNEIIQKYFIKLEVMTLIGPDGKIIGYL